MPGAGAVAANGALPNDPALPGPSLAALQRQNPSAVWARGGALGTQSRPQSVRDASLRGSTPDGLRSKVAESAQSTAHLVVSMR